MFCTNCGKKLNVGEFYCVNCVKKVNSDVNYKISKSDNNIITVILIVAIVLILGCFGIVYLMYNYRINSMISLIKIPYANQTIEPGMIITYDMISYMEVPENFNYGFYYIDISNLVGKCSNTNTMIADGSIFYKDFVVDCDYLLDNDYILD